MAWRGVERSGNCKSESLYTLPTWPFGVLALLPLPPLPLSTHSLKLRLLFPLISTKKKKKKLGQDATDHILAFHPAHVITDRLPRFIIGQLSDSEVANVPLVSSNWQKVKTKWMERSREMRFSV